MVYPAAPLKSQGWMERHPMDRFPLGIGDDASGPMVSLAATILADVLGVEYLTALAMVEATREAVTGTVK